MRAYKFEISGEEEIIAANTAIEALKFYKDLTGLSLEDFYNEDDIYEFPESEWSSYKIRIEDGDITNIAEMMEEISRPTFLSSTVE